MGGKQSIICEERLKIYQECTFFTRKQILHLYKKFSSLNPTKINPKKADATAKISFIELQSLPELKQNPFSHRICEVFCSSGRGISFEDFLDMCSMFSEEAPWQLKASYAFRIFDYNSDARICSDDLEKLLIAITGDGITSEEIKAIVERVMKEVDIDQDGSLSYPEFEHMISRAPDFVNLFRMTV